ncbi:MAG: TonB family protein, partial [Bacteriovoracaceae bacterium]|nr:TonB family protein [Bacteriovoracaceae bacterium]
MNFSKELTHFEKKTQPKKAKTVSNLSAIGPSPQKVETKNELENENIDENINEKASGRDQSLISQYASQVAKLIDERKFYPLMAKKMKQEGEVILKISLDKEGHILNLEIEKSSIYPSLNTAALDCVKKIDFFPPIPLELGVD